MHIIAEISHTISAELLQGLTTQGQGQPETKQSVMVLVLQVWCCVLKHGLVTLIVIMILKDTATFQYYL